MAFLFLRYVFFTDIVEEEFSWLFNSELYTSDWQLCRSRRNWYRAYKVHEKTIMKIHLKNFKEYNFTGWQRFDSMYTLIDGHTLDGNKRLIYVNKKEGFTRDSFICMFLDLERHEIVLLYSIT